MGTGPIPASRKALEKAGWKVDDLDLVEANEAFAAQAIAVNKDMGWDTGKVNVNGGAIALGHPIGASGGRVLVTLLHEMGKRDAKKGLATLVHRRRHGHRHVRRARLSLGPSQDAWGKGRPAARGPGPVHRGGQQDGTGGIGHGRQPRDRCRDLGGAAGGRLPGRGELCRQRRGGAALQGRDRHPGLQVERRRLRGLRRGHRAGRGRARAGRRAGQQCRHHARRDVPPHEPRAVAGGDLHQSERHLQHDPPVWPGMRERKFGRIINISSVNGQKGQVGQVNYSAAKAGDIGFTKALAQEGARNGITVNAICPGYIGTEMVRAVDEKVLDERILPQIPVGRLGEPEEIARCVVFLASDDAGFITGSTLTANGGQYLA